MPATPDVLIDTFHPDDQPAFEALNRAWLEEHGLIEDPDERQLRDPIGQIVAPGGQIFVARRRGEVIGTCAVMPHGQDVLELVKLTVAPDAQGHGLGRRLVETCLAFAGQRRARRLVLLSSSKLDTALHLYERLGFRRAPIPSDALYLTADVYMELDLPSPQPDSA